MQDSRGSNEVDSIDTIIKARGVIRNTFANPDKNLPQRELFDSRLTNILETWSQGKKLNPTPEDLTYLANLMSHTISDAKLNRYQKRGKKELRNYR